MTIPDDTEAYCELSFSPNVRLISTVRVFVKEFYARVLNDENITSRLVVATHELLENAVRYASDGQSSIRIGVRPVSNPVYVTIKTRNKSLSANRAELTTLIESMKAANDRTAFYRDLMRKSAKRTEGSGLGLGRIVAETEMDLTCHFDGDYVELLAQASFQTKDPK
jgi:hypothetical protein